MCGGSVKSSLPGLRHAARAVLVTVTLFWGAIWTLVSWVVFG